jgi:hypothetical protein
MSPGNYKQRAAIMAAATMALALAAETAEAYQCKNYPHQAVGVRPLKGVASVAARKNWSNTAKSQYGLSWSVWSIAQSKSVSCVRLNTGKWRCLASAKPCNYVVP